MKLSGARVLAIFLTTFQLAYMWSVYDYKIRPRLNFTRKPVQTSIKGRTDVKMFAGRPDVVSYTKTDDYDGMPDMCLWKGFYYCVSDNLCHKTKEEAKDCVQSCSKNLSMPKFCSALGCVFNYASKTCGGEIAASRRFAFNFCGEATTDSEGNWYIKDERGSEKHCYPQYIKLINISNSDRELYRQCAIDTVSVYLWIPILDDGNYEIVLKFAEPGAKNLYRAHNGTLNGVTLFVNHNVCVGIPAGCL